MGSDSAVSCSEGGELSGQQGIDMGLSMEQLDVMLKRMDPRDAAKVREQLGSTGKRKAQGGRIRQSNKQLNATEKEFARRLAVQCMTGELYTDWGRERYKLELANGCWYTPDFHAVYPDGRVCFFEVKGHFEDDAVVKLKVVARMFPQHDFYLVTKLPKGQGGGFSSSLVLP